MKTRLDILNGIGFIAVGYVASTMGDLTIMTAMFVGGIVMAVSAFLDRKADAGS